MNVATFRADFTEFANTTNYPDSMITFWLTYAARLVDETRWGDCYDLGVELFVAHNIVLERDAVRRAAAGATPGQASGPLASKTVDKVSISYDTASAMEPGAGHWNLTVYGQRYARMVQMFGAGGIQL